MGASGSPWGILDVQAELLHESLDHLIKALSGRTRLLAESIAEHLEGQRFPWPSRHRLFAVAVLGSQGMDPTLAMPVSVSSALWWAGAEALDDIVDGIGNGQSARRLLAALPGGIASLVVLPLDYLDGRDVTGDLKGLWRRELLQSCRLAAEGQVAEGAAVDVVDRDDVLDSYRGKTGAAYARDAVMAAGIGLLGSGADAEAGLEEWREFGMRYGTLRQLHNDNSGDTLEDDEDLANATPTLLMAHAFQAAGPSIRRELVALREAARSDLSARRRIREILYSDATVESYVVDVRGLHHRACLQLDSLCPAGGAYRDVLRAGLDLATISAIRLDLPES